MAEHLLHRTQVGSTLEQMRCERVAEKVWMHATGLEPRLLGDPAQDQERSRPGQRSAARVQEQIGPMPDVQVRPAEREVAANRLGCGPPERHDPLLVALADHAHDAGVDVDRRPSEPDCLGDTKPCSVHQLDERAVAQRTRCCSVRGLHQALGF